MSDTLSQSLLQTLAYFSLFNYPLTGEELFRRLWKPDALSTATRFRESLKSLVANGTIAERHGFYFLPGKAASIAGRERAIRVIEKKLQIAKRAAKILRFVPFLQAMFVCNTVAAGVAAPDSDIDVLIVIRDGRMWIGRLFATLLLSMFRLRRHGATITDRICLSFYATDTTLGFSSIRIAEPDIYLSYWVYELIPIYDSTNLYKKIQDENSWTKKYLPNEQKAYSLLSRYRVSDSRISAAIKKFFATAWDGAYGNIVEAQAKSMQMNRMKMHGRSTKEKPNSGVIISDTMLKFHEEDRRMFYRDEWLKRCKQTPPLQGEGRVGSISGTDSSVAQDPLLG